LAPPIGTHVFIGKTLDSEMGERTRGGTETFASNLLVVAAQTSDASISKSEV
jgi:hypothetical protein